LSDNQAVEAINILRGIEPDEIDSLVRASEEHLDMPTESRNLDELAHTVISSLGSVRANAAYCLLKEMKKELKKNRLYRESPEFNANYKTATTLYNILLKAAPPLSKVVSVAPAKGPVFDPNRREFWDNIVREGVECYDAIDTTNAQKTRNFYRNKITKTAPWLMESLTKLYEGGSSCDVMVSVLDATISGRPLPLSEFDKVKSAAVRCGVGDLVV
jgi:hypothetical protein